MRSIKLLHDLMKSLEFDGLHIALMLVMEDQSVNQTRGVSEQCLGRLRNTKDPHQHLDRRKYSRTLQTSSCTHNNAG